jgi:hypothetical protein
VLSIDLAVLCCIDLDVLCIQSGSATAVAGLSCASSCWSVLFLATHQSCCCHRCSTFFLVSLVREKLSYIALMSLLRIVVVAHYPWLGCCCYAVACDIVAAGQSCEWWTTSDAAASIRCLSLSVSHLPFLICYNKTAVKRKIIAFARSKERNS